MPITLRIPIPARLGKFLGLTPSTATSSLRPTGLDEVERQLRQLEQRLAQLPPDSPERAGPLNNLGNRLRDRYLWTLHAPDLDRAVEIYDQALDVLGPSPTAHVRAQILDNQGCALFDRYLRAGSLVDLERSIERGEEAVGLSEAALFTSNLSNRLRERFYRTANTHDADRAVELAERAAALAQPNTLESAGAHINLGLARMVRAGPADRASLDQAIESFGAAAAEVPATRPERAVALAALGMAEMQRYRLDPDDDAKLDHAINVLATALAAAHPSAPGAAATLHSLGKGFWQRFERTRLARDLDNATQALTRAVEQTPEGMAELPMYLNDLAIVLSERFFVADAPDTNLLQPTIDVLERAWSNVQTSFASDALAYQLGHQWHATSLGIGERLVVAYDQLAQLDPSRAELAHRRMLELAEGSKSRVLTQLVGRGDMPAPPGVSADVVARERELVARLIASESADLASYGRALPGSAPGNRADDRTVLRTELQQVWLTLASASAAGADYVALRSAQPPGWGDLVELTAKLGAETALMSMFSTNSRTMLLLLRGGFSSPRIVEIELSSDNWTDLLRRLDREVRIGRGRRGETWSTVLKPLFEATTEHLAGISRVVLAPQSHSLPVPWAVVVQHAGLHSPDGGRMPLVTLPALGMLPRLAARPPRQSGSVVVVGNPLNDLPHAEREAQQVAEVLGESPLIGSAATRGALIERLAEARVVHLATHAQFDPTSPLDSGIVLADGVLTARDILQLRLQADLLVLSACETGVAGAVGGELAGLTQAFLQAGARSLVVSLWKIDDAATGKIMTSFHVDRQAGVSPDLSLRDAMDRVRSQASGSGSYLWGPFVFIGDWQG